MNKAQEKRIAFGRFFNEESLHVLDPAQIMISTTGSDGRFENKAHPGIRSNLEVQIVTTVDHNMEEVSDLMNRMREIVGFNLENVEHKRLGIDKLCLYNNNPNLVFPTRYFDSVIFFDPSAIRSKILQGISDEIMKDSRLTVKMYDRFCAHRRIMESGKDKIHGKTYSSYNINTGTIRYDPENYVFGIKNGPMRYVQYLLAVALMRYIRDTKTHHGLINELPTNIIDRLEYIQDNALTSKNRCELLRMREIYEFFLHIYHEMQYRHFSEGATDFVIEDVNVLKDIRDMLECLRDSYKIEHFYPVKK